uniref:Transmembrane serine protease 13b n=1 Tax=Sinocyclocheilus grahami TaxID=75366 RepID=A0A672PV31_SINGR
HKIVTNCHPIALEYTYSRTHLVSVNTVSTLHYCYTCYCCMIMLSLNTLLLPHSLLFFLCLECGKPPGSRIIGGSVAADGQWPWQASLHFQGYHTCGGTLVAPDFKLTASPSQDIALLKLSKPASIIQPVCLPVFGQMFPAVKQCWTTGFGVTREGAGISTYLMEVAVDLIDSAVCNSPTVYGGRITEHMLCAGDLKRGRDSCQGDSGGPLVCKADDKWYLTGVTSWGDGCGKQNRPGVYSNVGQLLMWIYGKMQQQRP